MVRVVRDKVRRIRVRGHTEVDELGVASVVEHDVLRLDVAVADVLVRVRARVRGRVRVSLMSRWQMSWGIRAMGSLVIGLMGIGTLGHWGIA